MGCDLVTYWLLVLCVSACVWVCAAWWLQDRNTRQLLDMVDIAFRYAPGTF